MSEIPSNGGPSPLDRIDLFSIFSRIVECASFTRAADTLGVPRSSASAVVQELEGRVGARLLHRTTRPVSCCRICRRLGKGTSIVPELSHRFHQPVNSLTVVGANASAAVFQSPARISGPSDKSWNDRGAHRVSPIICSRSR